jgi:alpha-L-rhamnosidase
MNSFNHYSLGSVGEWLYRFVLGIDQEGGTAGFRRLLLRPHPVSPLSWARGSYQSVRGIIKTEWERSGDRFTLRVAVPANVTASVRVPSASARDVRDAAGGAPQSVEAFPGAVGAEEAVFLVASGTHEFTGPAMTRDADR